MVSLTETTPRTSVELGLISVELPKKVIVEIGKMAKAVGTKPAIYAARLMMAAYTARATGETGDRDLDDAVARVLILDSVEDVPAEDIAKYLGLHVETVRDIIRAWREEQAGRREPKRRRSRS